MQATRIFKSFLSQQRSWEIRVKGSSVMAHFSQSDIAGIAKFIQLSICGNHPLKCRQAFARFFGSLWRLPPSNHLR
jgi:hypothetical protein